MKMRRRRGEKLVNNLNLGKLSFSSLIIIPGEPPKKKEKVAVEEMDVPDKVFGGLKKPSAE